MARNGIVLAERVGRRQDGIVGCWNAAAAILAVMAMVWTMILIADVAKEHNDMVVL